MRGRRKTKVNLASLVWLQRIWARRGDGVVTPHTASDVLDGWATRKDLADLIKRRVLTVIHDDPKTILPREQCGSSWTVHLTVKGMRIFYPGWTDEYGGFRNKWAQR